jgi:hypothetical protein
MSTPTFFVPHALAAAPVITETRLIRDYSMPERDWSAFEEPTHKREMLATRFRKEPAMVPDNLLFLVRQAS